MSVARVAGGCVLDIGEALREAREARGLGLEQAAQDTRISLRFLEALEAEQFEELPAPVYVRGFMRSYANYLGIDPQPLIDELALRERGGGYAARPGEGTFYGAPARASQRPGSSPNPFQPRAPEPARTPTNVTAFPAASAPADDRDDEPDDSGAAAEDIAPVLLDDLTAGDVHYEDWPPAAAQRAGYRDRRTAGLLLERETAAREGGRGTMVITGLVLAGIGAVAALLVLGGGGGGAPVGPGGETPQATGTSAGGVIEVRTPTPEQSPGSVTGTVSPSATGTVTTTPTAEDTTTVTATSETGGATAIPPATATPTTAAATATPPPPTATPTPTPTTEPPTPTPTVVAHAHEYIECSRSSASGELDCGVPPFRVVCAPDGWFLDVAPFFPAEDYGWTVKSSDTTGGARTVC